MARLPQPFRSYSTGGSNSRTYFIVRDGATISTSRADINSRQERTYASVTEAKRVMNNPVSLCTF